MQVSAVIRRHRHDREMNDYQKRLLRRTTTYRRPDAVRIAQYLEQVQEDTAALAEIGETLQDLGPAYLRNRAAYYRHLAGRELDLQRAQQLLDLAASLEGRADVKEAGPGSSTI